MPQVSLYIDKETLTKIEHLAQKIFLLCLVR